MKTILCVDDVESNLYILELLFKTYHKNKYKLLLASSGKQALSLLLKKDVDIILLDIMMPEMDGYETAKLVYSNKKTENIPIIFLTEKLDEKIISKCFEIGGVDYLNKPYNAIELFTRIEFHLDLIDSKQVLLKEKAFVQDMLDLQENLLIVTDGKGSIRVNEATSKFFNYNLSCLSNEFIEEDGYFHMGLVDDDEFWIDKLEQQDSIVLIEDVKSKKEEIFDIKVKKFKNNYLITLTNITSIAKESKAYYDDLTQIYNKSKLNDILSCKLNNINEPFSYILLDIDNFKEVNDNYGHLVGDDVLKQMSGLIKQHIRETDIFARWGGEEFVLILPNIGINKAVDIANTLRIKIEVEYFKEVNNITCSFGVTSHIKNDNIDLITKRAYDALYKAKESGKNQVCILE